MWEIVGWVYRRGGSPLNPEEEVSKRGGQDGTGFIGDE